MSTRIEIARTPNPDALKFQVPTRLVERSHEFAAGADTSAAPLARRLLGLEGVQMVMIAPDFVTVERSDRRDWGALGARVTAELQDFLDSYEMAVVEGAAEVTQPRSETEAKILALLDEYVRPAVADDGGEVHYIGFEQGIVRLSLRGACGTCPSSMTTLKMGVERLLREHIPEVEAVENVI